MWTRFQKYFKLNNWLWLYTTLIQTLRVSNSCNNQDSPKIKFWKKRLKTPHNSFWLPGLCVAINLVENEGFRPITSLDGNWIAVGDQFQVTLKCWKNLERSSFHMGVRVFSILILDNNTDLTRLIVHIYAYVWCSSCSKNVSKPLMLSRNNETVFCINRKDFWERSNSVSKKGKVNSWI